jgi:ribosomal-protein-alanine N-acetyltransferase
MKTETSPSEKGGEDGKPPSILRATQTIERKDPSCRGRFFVLPKCSSKIFNNIKVEVITDLPRCFDLWQEFSPKQTLFDCWEFRLSFYNAYKFKPYFILIKNLSENLAILPLEYSEKDSCYTWFGSSWHEENKFFVKNPIYTPLLLELAPKPLSLEAIDASGQDSLKEFIKLEPDSPKYILDLQNMSSSEDFLMNLSKNKRHGLRKDRRRIEKQNPQIIIDKFSDLDNLINLSRRRFHEKGENTDWEDPRRIETFKQVINLADRTYKLRMISIYINNQPAAVDLIAIFNGCYYALKCGYDVKNFPGIGNFMNLFEIDDAISMRMKRFDLLQNNYEWKDRLFQQIPLYKYKTEGIKTDKKGDFQIKKFRRDFLKHIMEIEKSCFSIYDAYPQERIEKLAREHEEDFLVVENEGKILGYIIAYNHDGIGHIDSLGVDPFYRNKGIGKMMLDYIINRFKQQGLKTISLEVRVINNKALSLFKSLGFKIKGTLKAYYRDMGDAYQMQREL